MKKLLLFVSVLALGLNSCSKDDEPASTASLEGRWELTKDGIFSNGQEDLQDWVHTAGCSRDYTDFTANTFTDHQFYNNGSECADSMGSTNSYTRSGNTITVNNDGSFYTLEILQLDSNTLKIKDPQTQYIQVFKKIAIVAPAPALTGNWEYWQEGIAMNGTEMLQDFEHAPGCLKSYTNFTLSTITDHIIYDDGSGCTEETGTATYTRNGNILTTNFEGITATAEIMQLDANTLKIKTTQTEQGQTIDYITVYKRM